MAVLTNKPFSPSFQPPTSPTLTPPISPQANGSDLDLGSSPASVEEVLDAVAPDLGFDTK
jgi:hypothetical protein